MSTSLEKRTFQSTDMIQDDHQQEASHYPQQQHQQRYENSLEGSTLEETNEGGNHSFETQQGSSASGGAAADYLDPNMQHARQRLSEIHEKMESVLNNYLELVVLGSEASGKSSIIHQYISKQFTEEYVPTVTEHYYKTIYFDNDSITLNINECGGRSEFKQLQHQFIADGNAFLIVCSVLDDPEQCQSMIDEIVNQINNRSSTNLDNQQSIGNVDQTPIVIILNKSDILESQEKYLDILDEEDMQKARSVHSLVEKKALQYKLPFVSCNARDFNQVNDIFNIYLLKELMKKQKPIETTKIVQNVDVENQLKQYARENKQDLLLDLLSTNRPTEECFKKLLFISILHEDASLLGELIHINKKDHFVKEELSRIEMLVDEESHFKANLLLFALMENNRKAYKLLKEEGLRLKASKLPKQQNLLLIVLQSLEVDQGGEDEGLDFSSDSENYSHERDVYLTDLALEIFSEQEKELSAYVNDPCVIEDEVRYPLHYAIDLKSYLIAEWLLRHNANVDVRDFSGRTPLHRAIESGQVKLARLLLNAKANHQLTVKAESPRFVEKSIDRIISEECPSSLKEKIIALLTSFGYQATPSDAKLIELTSPKVATPSKIEKNVSFFKNLLKFTFTTGKQEGVSYINDLSYSFILGDSTDYTSKLDNTNIVNGNQHVTLLFQSKKLSSTVKVEVSGSGDITVTKALPDEIEVFVGGPPLVGKSRLLNNYVQGTITEQDPNSEEELYLKELKVYDQVVKVNLLDMNGDDEEYLDERIFSSNAFVLVCSEEQKNSIVAINELIEEILFVKRVDISQIPIVIVQNRSGNSTDHSLEERAKQLNVPYCYVSAKSNDELANLFENVLIRQLIQKQSPLKQFY
ncbi:ras family small GTPase [Naegleria gruberi]|uniref:Ras family small GTPase n=1 Tax=Naegleria gruberi TaxID=5762 RepID=D2VMY1_NAEGR|nr:ras family small GTPase [Naegleria gruberi]EFC41901.1 ras family small GTPase [Naegleria gruberi]|eukprot:XP_002674645.1 ras family small GTPase [Naegleria gruberi strain NEG-M]